MDRRRRAFTLVELLVVVGIIALLVTILMPSLGRALELTRRTICQTKLHSLGRAWQIYFQDNNDAIPKMYAVRDGPTQWDNVSQFDFLIWSLNGNPADWINSGLLYKTKLISSEDNYVCPTIRKNSGGQWFTRIGEFKGSFHGEYENPWPVHRRASHTSTTYGRRRTNYYDEESWSQLPKDDPRNKELILSLSGATAVSKPGDFSFMADGFHRPDIALLSHVPNINVLYLDGHVGMYEDVDGNVLYDNDVTDWSQGNNWILDDVWMIIDGYHKPPAGQ